MKRILLALLAGVFLLSDVEAQAPFYQRKTITIVVGYLAGDGYDIWARLLAAHMPRHIPGSPNVIVQNQPGAGSLVAANSIYNVARRDRTLDLSRSGHRKAGGAVRLGQVQMDRLVGKNLLAVLHADGYAV